MKIGQKVKSKQSNTGRVFEVVEKINNANLLRLKWHDRYMNDWEEHLMVVKK